MSPTLLCFLLCNLYIHTFFLNIKIQRGPIQSLLKKWFVTSISVNTNDEVSGQIFKFKFKLIWVFMYLDNIVSLTPCDGPGFDSRWERCIYRASRPSQGTVNGGAVSKWTRCWRDVKHKQRNSLTLHRDLLCDFGAKNPL